MNRLDSLVARLWCDETMHDYRRAAVQVVLDTVDEECSRRFRALDFDPTCALDRVEANFGNFLTSHRAKITEWISAQLPCVTVEALEEVLLEHVLSMLLDAPTPRLVRVKDPGNVRSRLFELVKYLLSLRQRMPGTRLENAPRLTHMAKVLTQPRTRPLRDEDAGGVTLADLVAQTLYRLQYWDLPPDLVSLRDDDIQEFLRLTWEKFAERTHLRVVAGFQARSFAALVKSALDVHDEAQPAVIAADTGFGKTEAFLLPIIFYSHASSLCRRVRSRAGCQGVFLYPRIDLANNQLERTLGYIYHLHQASLEAVEEAGDVVAPSSPLRVAVGHSGVDNATPTNPVPNFRLRCPQCGELGRDGWVQYDESFERLECTLDPTHCAAHEIVEKRLGGGARSFDLAISTVDTLHRRLMDHHGANVLWSKPLQPRFFVFDEIHLYENQYGAHVALLARRLRQALRYRHGTMERSETRPIFIASSATLADPVATAARYFDAHPATLEERLFVPRKHADDGGPAEMEAFGRDATVLLKIPPNRQVALEDEDETTSRVVTEQATLIQTAMCVWHSMPKSPRKYRLLTFIDSIDSVWRIGKHVHNAEHALHLFSLRTPVGRPQWAGLRTARSYPNNNCPLASTGDCTIPPRDCLTYSRGECWWTQVGDEAAEETTWDRPFRTQVHASGRRRTPGDKKLAREVWDVLFTSPTLEVGFDHPEVIATIQYLAPRSLASLLQRKGRAGRSQGDEPVTVVVLGNRQADAFLFHRPHMLSPNHLDPARFDPNNPFVRRQHVLSALFDFLSWKGHVVDCYQKCDMAAAARFLRLYRDEARQWIEGVVSSPEGVPSEAELDRFLKDAVDRLDALSRTFNVHTSRFDFRDKEPTRLFLQPPGTLREQRIDISIARGTSTDKEQHRLLSELLRVVIRAEMFRERNKGWLTTWIYPPDLMNECPMGNEGNAIPSTFIDVPVGGWCEVYDRSKDEILDREPRTFALNMFLPGGFKHRYKNFNSWMAPWSPSSKGAPWIDLSDSFGPGLDYEDLGPLATFRHAHPIPAPLVVLGARDAFLVEPRTVSVEPGRTGDHGPLFYNPSSRTFSRRKENALSWTIQRDPISAPQFIDLFQASSRSRELLAHPLVGRLEHDRSASFLRVWYANLVTAYMKNERPRTLVARFTEDGRQRDVLPATRMMSESVMFHLEVDRDTTTRLTELLGYGLSRSLRHMHWASRLVFRLIDGEASLSSLHEIEALTESLHLLEWRALTSLGLPLVQLSQSQMNLILTEIRPVLERLGAPWLRSGSPELGLLSGHWDDLRVQVIAPSDAAQHERTAQALAYTLAAGLRLLAAEATMTNPNLFCLYAEATEADGRWRLDCGIFDNMQGGSGGCQRFAGMLHGVRSVDFIQKLLDTTECSQAGGDETLLRMLCEPEFQPPADSEASALAMASLRHLTDTAELADFHREVAHRYTRLRDTVGCAPSPWDLAINLVEAPVSSSTARVVLDRFLERDGGICPLVPRLQDLVPVCESTCPSCLGLRQELGSPVQPIDRHLLRLYLSGSGRTVS